MKILGTGLSGLIGSRVVEMLTDFDFRNLSLETGVDISDTDKIAEIIKSQSADWVFHFAALTDVDKAESDRILGEKSLFWIINVKATENIARLCSKYNKKLLYLSSDYVFDGKKDIYTEEDEPNPAGFYALTKYEGEKLVRNLCPDSIICRIANPYCYKQSGKKDFVHKIIELLERGNKIESPRDQIFTPTFIDDIAKAINYLINTDLRGIFHIVGSQALSPYESALMIADKFLFDKNFISPGTFEKYFKGRAPRPLHANLSNDKISSYGIKMSTFEEGLENIIMQKGNSI